MGIENECNATLDLMIASFLPSCSTLLLSNTVGALDLSISRCGPYPTLLVTAATASTRELACLARFQPAAAEGTMRACAGAALAGAAAAVSAPCGQPRGRAHRAATSATPAAAYRSAAAAAHGSAARQQQRRRTSAASWGMFGGGGSTAEAPAAAAATVTDAARSSSDEGAPIEEEKEELDPSAPLALRDVDKNSTSKCCSGIRHSKPFYCHCHVSADADLDCSAVLGCWWARCRLRHARRRGAPWVCSCSYPSLPLHPSCIIPRRSLGPLCHHEQQ
jgi:hypothetical protein